MALYQNATDIYHSKTSLHDGDTYTHEYKSVLEQIRAKIRELLSYDTGSAEITALKIELTALDDKRKTLEEKLLALNPDFIMMLQVVSNGRRDEVSSRLGTLDAETDGTGSQMLFNMLGLPGSEAKAVALVAKS